MEQVTKVVVIDRFSGEPRIGWGHGYRASAAGEEGDVHWLFGVEDLRRVAAEPEIRDKEQERRCLNQDETAQPGGVGALATDDEHPPQRGGDDADQRHDGAAERHDTE